MANNKDKKISNLPAIFSSDVNSGDKFLISQNGTPKSIAAQAVASYAHKSLLDVYGTFQKGFIPTTILNELPISRFVQNVSTEEYIAESIAGDGDALVYDSTIRRLLMNDGTEDGYYRYWSDSEDFGIPDDLGVIPFADRVYTILSETNDGPIVKTYLRWNGRELVEFTPIKPAIIPFSKFINSDEKDSDGEYIYNILSPSHNAEKPYSIPGQNEVVFNTAKQLFYLKVIEEDGTQSLWKNWIGSSDYGTPKPNGIAPYPFKIYFNSQSCEYLQYNGYTLGNPESPAEVHSTLETQIDEINDWVGDVFQRSRFSLGSFVAVTATTAGSTADFTSMYVGPGATLVYSTTTNRLYLKVANDYYLDWQQSNLYGTVAASVGSPGIIPHHWITFVVKEEVGEGIFKTTYRRWNGHHLAVVEPPAYTIVEFNKIVSIPKSEITPGNKTIDGNNILFNFETNTFILQPSPDTYFNKWYDSETFGEDGMLGVIPDKFKTYYCRETKKFYQFSPVTQTLEPAISPYEAESLMFDRLFDSLCHPRMAYITDSNYIGKIIYENGEKIYRLNGLDLTYKEAVDVVADTMRVCPQTDAALPQTMYATGRTNFCLPTTVLDRSGSIYGSSYETFRVGRPLSSGKPAQVTISNNNVFASCSNLHTIIGTLYITYDAVETKKKIFSLPKLENANFKVKDGVEVLDLSGCPLLTKESLASIANNFNGIYSTTLTVIVTPTIMDLMQSVMEWGIVADDAYQKHIIFVDSY